MKNDRKGISLVGLIIVLAIVVCIEGFYIVKLRDNTGISNNLDEVKDSVAETKNEEKTVDSKNDKIISSLGYSSDTMIDSILDSINEYAKEGKIIRTNEAKDKVESIEKEKYADLLKQQLDNNEVFVSVAFKDDKLKCEYNLKNVLKLLELDSENYKDLGANDNNIKVYEF